MAYSLREGQGSLFKNKHKEEGDNKPNLTGEVKINGVIYRASAWTKVTKNGDKWLSLNIQIPRDRDEKQHEPRKTGLEAAVDMDDDIPY